MTVVSHLFLTVTTLKSVGDKSSRHTTSLGEITVIIYYAEGRFSFDTGNYSDHHGDRSLTSFFRTSAVLRHARDIHCSCVS